MTKCVCMVCGRTVNGRVPATSNSGLIVPYRHLPPGQLGGDRFLHGRWCMGSWEPAKPLDNLSPPHKMP